MSLGNDSMPFTMNVEPAGSGSNGNCNSGWGGDWGAWIILFLIFGLFGWGGMGGFGGFGGFGGMDRGGESRSGYSSRRDSRGRYSREGGYSRGEGTEEMMEHVRMAIESAPDEYRDDLKRFMRELENA